MMQLPKVLECAVAAAQAAGRLMKENHLAPKRINSTSPHDIKLELDVRCQKRIERCLRKGYPGIPLLGEEGLVGDPSGALRWVVDPIDGTVNFAHEIPHCCTSIALQGLNPPSASPSQKSRRDGINACDSYATLAGVIFDPFTNELWTAIRGKPAHLNGDTIQVSSLHKLSESILSVGFAKSPSTLRRMLPVLNHLIPRVRKIRMMGSAALAMAYVAGGRLDGYLEYGLRLWDVAAGGLIVECAGGNYWRRKLPGKYTYHVIVSNGNLARSLARFRKE